MNKKIPAGVLSLALALSLAVPAAALSPADTARLLQEHYVDDIPAAVLQASTTAEMLRLLGDPYTVYYDAQQYEDFLTSIDGESLVGIGVSIQTVFHDGFRLLSILPNSPAQEAGLQKGEVVIAVDGRTMTAGDTPGLHLSGAEGTSVTVTLRAPDGSVRDVTLVRRKVQVPILTYEQVGSAGFVTCDSFGQDAPDGMRAAIAAMDPNTAVWVADLRDNPGGTSSAAANMAGAFLGPKLMVYFRDADGGYYQTSATRKNLDLTDKPLIILTSDQSASAAELFSAAIRDHRGGIAIGQRTYGKGIAQKVYDRDKYPELFTDDALKITVYRFFSPDGATNHIVGVLPTLLVEEGHTETAALILSAPKPERSLHNWKLELCGQTFYLDRALCAAQPGALKDLLEALPPAARLYRGTGTDFWKEMTAADLAAEFSIQDYTPRTFTDVEGHLYQDQINTLHTYDLVSGGEDGLFHPEQTLTRGQLAAMLTRALNLPESGLTFSDVSPQDWYADAVSAVAARGLLNGTGDGRFSPDAPVTRQEFYTALSALAAWASMDGYEWAQKDVSAVQWVEFYDYPEWAQGPARNLDKLGLTIERTDPAAPVTRGQAAGQLGQLMENLGMLWAK